MGALEDYKNELVSTYKWPIDNTEVEIEKRRQLLAKKYTDEYLEQIIFDTNSFIKDMLAADTIKHGYFKSAIDEDTTFYINLNLHGGWFSDILYIDAKGRKISNYILRKVLGCDVMAEVTCDEIEDDSDEDILSYYYRYYIYVQHVHVDIDEIINKISNEENAFTKKISLR